MDKIPYLGQTLLRWQVGASTFLALPELGARLMNWNILLADGDIRDVIHWPQIDSLTDFHRVKGGNPILFPFCGKSFDDDLVEHWKGADGIRRPMPAHGVARQGQFKITRLDEGGFSAQFVPGPAAQEAYPFDYEFTVSYRFEPLGLFVELSLHNLGKQPIPWAAGHHFYFAMPWTPGLKRGDYTIKIPAKSSLQINDRGALVAGPVISQSAVDNPALINLQSGHLTGNSVVVSERDTDAHLTVRIGGAKVPPKDNVVVTWAADDKVPYYCIEPWMAPANAIGHNQGIHMVAPGRTDKFLVEVSLK